MITLLNINKKYKERSIFSDLSFNIKDNELVCISGNSGSGKTTLLNILSLSDIPDSGDLTIDNYKNPSSKEVQQLRRNKIGYVFQNYGLIENETVEQNLDIVSKFSRLRNKEEIYESALNQLALPKEYLQKRYILSAVGNSKE